MDIQRTEAADPQQRWWEQEPVGRDDQRVRRLRCDTFARLRVLERCGLEDGQPALIGQPLDRARDGAQAAAGGTIRLGKDQGDFVARVQQARQSSFCELGRAGED